MPPMADSTSPDPLRSAGLPESQPDDPVEAAGLTEPEGWLSRFKQISKNPENLTVVGAAVLYLALLGIVAELFETSHVLREAMKDFVGGAFQPRAEGEIQTWFVLVAFVVLGLLFIALLYAMTTWLATRSLRREHIRMRSDYGALHDRFLKIRSERDRLGGANAQLENERGSLQTALTEAHALVKMSQASMQEERETSHAEIARYKERLEANVNETLRAVSIIGRKMFPRTDGLKGKTIRSAKITYHIGKNFDAEVHRRYLIRAGEVPLHYWKSSVNAPSYAQPVAAFTDLGFQLLSRDPTNDVVYLPVENDAFSKTAAIFFVPLVNPGEEREIEVVFRWPGLLLGLPKQGWEDFSFSFKSAEAMDRFELEVFLEDGSGGYLTCAEVGTPLPDSSITVVKNDRGWHGWRYQGKGIAPPLLADEIVARLEWKRS